jgi:predicted SpoU family rRNA methylase
MIEFAEASGADNVLLKGFPAQKLVAIVENLIERGGGHSLVQTDSGGGTNAN